MRFASKLLEQIVKGDIECEEKTPQKKIFALFTTLEN